MERGVEIVHHDLFVLTSMTPDDSRDYSLHKRKSTRNRNKAHQLDETQYGKACEPVADLPPQPFPSPFFSSYFHRGILLDIVMSQREREV
jgi:hypothetical protein